MFNTMFSHSKIKLNLDLKTPIDFENTKYPEIGFIVLSPRCRFLLVFQVFTGALRCFDSGSTFQKAKGPKSVTERSRRRNVSQKNHIKTKNINNNNNPPTPAYQGERAQRRLAKANNIEQASPCHAVSLFRGTASRKLFRC